MELKDVGRLRLLPGDKLVVSLDSYLSVESLKTAKSAIEAQFKMAGVDLTKNKVLILTKGANLSILSQEGGGDR